MSEYLSILLVMTALGVVHRPFGDYLASVFSSQSDWPIEKLIYRLTNVDAHGEQRWPTYARAVLVFSTLSFLGLFGLQRLLDSDALSADQAWNTAASFVSNTNWQSYSGETMSMFTQLLGLTVQNFLSAAVGLSVAVALIRGFARSQTDQIGNFWVDVTRSITRVLLPVATLAAAVLVLGGVVQTFAAELIVPTLAGSTQTIPLGPVASQEAIKLLGTNGGGFFNANSSHPFENPTAWTNLVEIFLLLLIPTALPRVFGRLIGDLKQGWAVLAAMGTWYFISLTTVMAAELAQPNAMEGKEVRFGVVQSALFAVSTTMTSTGAVNSMHSSYSPLGGGVLLVNMVLGEIAPGGIGSGLYGVLVLAIVTVFLAGLMVGRTPEYLGKKIGVLEIKLACLSLLVAPTLVLAGTGLAMAWPQTASQLKNPGAHGLTEVLYAFASASNNNGSAFAGLAANTPFFNVALGMAMILGRFVPIILVLALAGALAKQAKVPVSAGTLPTHGALFVTMLVLVGLIIAALTFLPALALGPLAEGLPA